MIFRICDLLLFFTNSFQDDEVEPEFQLLFASHGGEKVQQFQSSMTDYLKNLVPVSANDNV